MRSRPTPSTTWTKPHFCPTSIPKVNSSGRERDTCCSSLAVAARRSLGLAMGIVAVRLAVAASVAGTTASRRATRASVGLAGACAIASAITRIGRIAIIACGDRRLEKVGEPAHSFVDGSGKGYRPQDYRTAEKDQQHRVFGSRSARFVAKEPPHHALPPKGPPPSSCARIGPCRSRYQISFGIWHPCAAGPCG